MTNGESTSIGLGEVARWPISVGEIQLARERISAYLQPTPLRRHPELEAAVGENIRVFAKHENFQPTNSFKVRNGLAFMTALDEEHRKRGVVAATRGNHGLGLAYAARILKVATTLCVPVGNNPEKNAGMRALGAHVIEEGRDYDEATSVADRIARDEGCALAHGTNDRQVMCGAGTLWLECFEQEPLLEALVIAVGGGSQAVSALTVVRAFAPGVQVFGVQAAGASAAHDSWHAGNRIMRDSANTIADGLATRTVYEMTFGSLREGLVDFITVSDAEIASAMRMVLRTTHSLVEGAGAAGLAGLRVLAPRLAGKRVGIVLSGANVDAMTLLRILGEEA
jgi:threonine dehydratase